MELSLLTWLVGWLEHWRVMLNSTEIYVEVGVELGNMQVTVAVKNIVTRHCAPISATFCYFLIDSFVLPDVVCAVQIEGKDVQALICYHMYMGLLAS